MERKTGGLPISIKYLAAATASIVVIVVGVGALMAFGVVPIPGPIFNVLSGAKSPEHSARYVPPEASAYAWLTLAPGGGQFEQAKDAWGRLNDIPEFEDAYEDLRDELDDEFNYDIEDMKDWIGPDLSFACGRDDLSCDEMGALMIGVRDRGAAEEFVESILEYQEDEEGASFHDDDYGGFDIWIDEYGDEAYGLSGDLFIIASNEDYLEEIIDGVNGDVDESLADDGLFQAARAAMPDRRFASFYVNLADSDEAVDAFDDLADLPVDVAGAAPDWVAGSAAWGDRSIGVEVVTPSVLEFNLSAPEIDPPGQVLPKDTLVMATAAFEPDLDVWRDRLGEYDIADTLGDDAVGGINEGVEFLEDSFDVSGLPTASDRDGLDFLLDLTIAAVDEIVGADIETGFFDHLLGDLSFAAWGIALDEYGGLGDDVPPALVVLLSYDRGGEDELADTLDIILEYVEDQTGENLEPVDVGAGRDALVYRTGGDFSPGYVINDGYLIFGGSEDDLADTVDLQAGGDDTLADNPEYRRALELLPPDRQFQFYVNLNEFIRASDPAAFTTDFEGQEIQGQPILEETVGAFAFGYTAGNEDDGSHDRYAAVLTLFPK